MKTDKMKSQTSDNTFGEARLQRKIFVAMLVLSLGSALLLVGCERSAAGGASVDKRVADLEKQVAALQEQSRDVRVKLKAANGFGNSPLGDFFASPEFWQCTYDSSWADCSSRCAQQTAARRRLCFDKPEGPERVNCINENTAAGAACLKNCPVQMSPTELPNCGGGAGPVIH